MKQSTLGLLASSCFLAATLPLTAGLMVSLQPDSLPAGPGPYTIDVVVSGVSGMAAPVGIAGFSFEIAYSSAVVSPSGVAYGTSLGAAIEFDDLTTNPLFVSATSMETFGFFAGQPDTFTLATVTFNSVGTGSSPLALQAVSLTDENGDSLALIPEPRALAVLAGLGLAAFAGWRRQRA